MAKDRVWDIDMQVDGDGNVLVDEFRHEVRDVLHEVEVLMHRLGGAVVIASKRVEDGDGLFHTIGYRFEWQSFVPTKRPAPAAAQPAAPEPAPDPVPEPELAVDGVPA